MLRQAVFRLSRAPRGLVASNIAHQIQLGSLRAGNRRHFSIIFNRIRSRGGVLEIVVCGSQRIFRPSLRSLSTQGPEEGKEKEGEKEGDKEKTEEEKKAEEEDEYAEYPQEKIGFFRGLMFLTLAGVGLGSLYFIAKELMPSRMSPNYLFNEAFDEIKKHAQIGSRFGEPLRAYGADPGGRREGRRNFVENRTYKAEDGTDRLRIRFNLEGPFGHAYVFAEVSSAMGQGEFVYLLVQDLASGNVFTLIDNRALLDGLAQAKTPQEREALQQLLKGGMSQH